MNKVCLQTLVTNEITIGLHHCYSADIASHVHRFEYLCLVPIDQKFN